MGVNLSIKNVPVEKVELLKQRAKRNHRSLQGELLAILDHAIDSPKLMSLSEVSRYVQTLGLARRDEAVPMIGEDRDR